MLRQIFAVILISFIVNSVFPQNPFHINYSGKTEPENPLFIIPADTTFGNWNSIAPLSSPLCGVTSYYIDELDKIFICGGIDSAYAVHKKCYLYNPSSNTYQPADSLPTGRAFGTLVRVKDSLYLVSSINSNFISPDGAVYRYDIHNNKWIQIVSMNAPFVQEAAVCVWHDSLIVSIGGATSGFEGATTGFRYYDVYLNTWRTTLQPFIQPVTTAHAECIGNNIVVTGGYSYTAYNTVYHTALNSLDSTGYEWKNMGATPFGFSVYRVGGAKWQTYMLFGPALHNSSSIGEIWGLNIIDSTWKRFLPNTIDSSANRPQISVRALNDSIYFFLFGGMQNNSIASANSERYSFGNPFIGITGNGNPVPQRFILNQNYPNPFNPVTTITYEVPTNSFVKIVLYDILGRELKTLVNNYFQTGKYEIRLNADNLSSGIYIYTMSSENVKISKKMLILK
jgi:hypothetical protein